MVVQFCDDSIRLESEIFAQWVMRARVVIKFSRIALGIVISTYILYFVCVVG